MNILLKLNKNIILTMLFQCILQVLFANPNIELSGKISGTIIDANSNQPIEYANIILYRTSDSMLITGCITNSNGEFLIDKLPFNHYFLVAQFIGYEKKIFSNILINQDNNDIQLPVIKLSSGMYQLNEIEISGEKNNIEYKIDKKVLLVSQQNNATGGTALDVLQNNTMVHTNTDGSINLRGSSNFVILIDGKPSPLQGTDALRQIPANTIEKIEIITNPSAKYDAEGVSGIINIISKKNKLSGTSGIINFGTSSNGQYSGDLQINFKQKKTSTFIGADYRKGIFIQKFDVKRNFILNDTLFKGTVNSEQINTRPSGNIRSGADINFNDNDVISISGKIGSMQNLTTETQYSAKEQSAMDYGLFYKDNDEYKVDALYFNPTISYTHKFINDKHEINADAYFTKVLGDVNQYSVSQPTNAGYEPIIQSPAIFKSVDELERQEYTVKTDYFIYPDTINKIETGLQMNNNFKYVDLHYQNYNSGIWIDNPLLTYQYFFNQKVYSGYIIWSGKLRKFDFQIGLRNELTERILKQKELQNQMFYKKNDLFPSLFISKNLNESIQMQWNYSRRIRRPSDSWLNPFPYSSNASVINVGNPKLTPEYTDAFEWNTQKTFKKFSIYLNGYFRNTHDAITQLVLLDTKGAQIITFGNMKYNKFIGSEIALNIDGAKWLKINPGIDLMYVESNGMIGDYNASFDAFTYIAQMNTTIIINKKTRFQFGGTYNAKAITQQGPLDPYYNINASLKHEMLKNKLSIVLQGRNLFNSGYMTMSEYGIFFFNRLSYRQETNIFSVNLSYKINNYKKSNRLNQNGIDINL